jgi:hypothetical protein
MSEDCDRITLFSEVMGLRNRVMSKNFGELSNKS